MEHSKPVGLSISFLSFHCNLVHDVQALYAVKPFFFFFFYISSCFVLFFPLFLWLLFSFWFVFIVMRRLSIVKWRLVSVRAAGVLPSSLQSSYPQLWLEGKPIRRQPTTCFSFFPPLISLGRQLFSRLGTHKKRKEEQRLVFRAQLRRFYQTLHTSWKMRDYKFHLRYSAIEDPHSAAKVGLLSAFP